MDDLPELASGCYQGTLGVIMMTAKRGKLFPIYPLLNKCQISPAIDQLNKIRQANI
jgi:hypothetical protein